MAGPYRLLVFDWDGTLVDSEARIVGAARAAFADLGLPVPADGAIREIIGLSLEEAVKVLCPGSNATLYRRFVDYYRHHFVGREEPATLFPGVEPTLQALREQHYLLAIATGKSRAGLERELQVTGLRPMFDASRCADETSSKPHPQMLQELMEELDAHVGETIMVGDTEYDLQMARNAGVDALAVGYGVHDHGRLVQCGPVALLHAFGDLTAWLQS
ncbi:MAG: HAD-IA family hydrolase [Gammaproteobacteria bacterium]|nr:HAD-IA family hydrolase [Gammaproteobacteria bacterium]NIR85703.1 HAD-IA family hydrolase [Gammaproteobacteria bacterium]NIR90236.1 HAD-IA family hydrolase [Gammaproteobacteria bacterium]NIU06837.1 HAD-IA family hydrolase [Gammaproteobacteria bacterium]NIV53770.1 HAD-IA family hydrolase [Gammaproteobacteria bacterium]